MQIGDPVTSKCPEPEGRNPGKILPLKHKGETDSLAQTHTHRDREERESNRKERQIEKEDWEILPLAAESRWNSKAIQRASLHSLNVQMKVELASQDEPTSLKL